MKNWVVRVVTVRGDEQAPPLHWKWLECLRTCGLLRVHSTGDGGQCVDIMPRDNPTHGMPSKEWAESKSERMRSFGFNAAAAPMWPGDEP